MSTGIERLKPLYVALSNGFVDADSRSIAKTIHDPKYPDLQLVTTLMRPDQDGLGVISTRVLPVDGQYKYSGFPTVLMGFVTNQEGWLEKCVKFRDGHITVDLSKDPLKISDPFSLVNYNPPKGEHNPRVALATRIEVLSAKAFLETTKVSQLFRYWPEHEREFTRALAATGLPDRVNLTETLMRYCSGDITIDSVAKNPVVAA